MMRETTGPARRRIKALCVILAASALGGCLDTAVELGAPRAGAPRPTIAARPGVSPRGASVAFSSLEGAPQEVLARFEPLFARTAQTRDIATVAEPDAAYRLRAYLTAYAGPEGATRVAYVFDVFDRGGRRAHRLTDEVAVRSVGEPWSALDDKALAELVARSADELAAFLSNTPEALASAGGESGVTIATATRPESAPLPGAAKPLGFAEAR
jgi:hypothetical protein